jgi:hypothetical protein
VRSSRRATWPRISLERLRSACQRSRSDALRPVGSSGVETSTIARPVWVDGSAGADSDVAAVAPARTVAASVAAVSATRLMLIPTTLRRDGCGVPQLADQYPSANLASSDIISVLMGCSSGPQARIRALSCPQMGPEVACSGPISGPRFRRRRRIGDRPRRRAAGSAGSASSSAGWRGPSSAGRSPDRPG